MVNEITITFDDGSKYILCENKVGDTIIGVKAHKVMHELNRWLERQDEWIKTSIYKKAEFILNRSEFITDKN